jgi:catechol 2,3-dioxygenase-like lactoylglutathione lyase family enzyme
MASSSKTIEEGGAVGLNPSSGYLMRKEQIMIKVNGIAGVFVYAQDPKRLADWYALHFGLEFLSDIADSYFMEFYHRDDTDPMKRHSTVFAIMPAKRPLGAERGEYLINYRVDNLAGFLAQLQARGVATGPVEEQNDGRYPGSKGLFTWITDLEGNHIELYQPV